MNQPQLDAPQLPGGFPVFVPGGIDIATADSRYLRKNSLQVNATDYLMLGASPPASGAIRIDAASYANIPLNVVNGGISFRFTIGGGDTSFGAESAHQVAIRSNGQHKWLVYPAAAGISELHSAQATARIIGGSTNGLSVRNSAHTRDNLLIADAGDTLTLNSGTYTGQLNVRLGAGEIPNGMWVKANDGVSLVPATSSAGVKALIGYWDSSAYSNYRSAAEVASAAGFSTLYLMKSGGAVVVGTDPGGAVAFRVGGSVTIGGTGFLAFGGNGLLKSPSDGVVTLLNNAQTDFARLQFGGTTNAFPALRRTGAGIDCVTADASAWTLFSSGTIALNAAAGSVSAGVVRLGNATQTTVGAAGAASALPANPSGYLRFFLGATEYVLPYYAQA